MIPVNPDLRCVELLSAALKSLTVEYPDGEVEDFQTVQVDTGFVSTPTRFPYVSVHTGPARGRPARMVGSATNLKTYDIEVECVITIEYEDVDPLRGYQRLTALRWEVWRHLVAHKLLFRAQGVEFANIEESSLNYLTDDGSFQDWGFTGVVAQPVTVKFSGM